MFDIGFSEIVVVGVVALVVIGPEKLPRVARTLGHMFGRLQRYVGEVKADITREIELDELRKLQTEVKDAARDFEHSVTNVATEFRSTAREIETQLNSAASGGVASAAGATPEAVTAAAGHPALSEGAGSVPEAPGSDASRSHADLSSSVPPSFSGEDGGISAAHGPQASDGSHPSHPSDPSQSSQPGSMPPHEQPPLHASSAEPSELPRQPTLPGFDRI